MLTNQFAMLVVLMLSLFCYCAHCSEEVVKAEPASREKNPTFDQPPEISVWERLGNASTLDIESSDFSWNMLSSLHHTEHSSSSEHSEDEMSKALEVCCCLMSI
jgi:atypical dual specificity phosphatase